MKTHSAKKSRGRTPSKGRHGQHQKRHHDRCVRKNIGQGVRNGWSVVDHEIGRPRGEPQIPHDHHGLVQQVGPHADSGSKAGRACARGCSELKRENQPREREADVEPPTNREGRAKRIEQEDAIEERDDHGCCDHRFLHAHAEGAGGNGHGLPQDRGSSIVCSRFSMAAQARVQGDQVTQRHQRFGALGDVGDRIRRQRMHDPEKRDRRRPDRMRRLRSVRADVKGPASAAPDRTAAARRRCEWRCWSRGTPPRRLRSRRS